MKKIILIIILFFNFTIITLANVSPNSRHGGSGGIEFDSGSLISKNVSVEKHILLFKTSDKDLGIKYNLKGLGYDFLEKNLGFSRPSVGETESYNEDEIDFEVGNNIFLTKWTSYFKSGSVDIAVRYYLKNNSDKKIEKQATTFYFGRKTEFFGLKYNEIDKTEDKTIYILNNENDYPKNFKAYDGKNKLSITENFKLQEVPNEKYKKVYSINKVSTFDLSFQPNETKILTITYSIPFKMDFVGGKYIDYDYSPIFNWKDGNVKKSNIYVIGDDNNILYSSATRIGKYRFNRFAINRYGVFLNNVNNTKGIDDIKIYFTNSDLGFGIYPTSEILNSLVDGAVCEDSRCNISDYYINNIEFLPCKDPQKVIIKEKTGKIYEIDVFNLMK